MSVVTSVTYCLTKAKATKVKVTKVKVTKAEVNFFPCQSHFLRMNILLLFFLPLASGSRSMTVVVEPKTEKCVFSEDSSPPSPPSAP